MLYLVLSIAFSSFIFVIFKLYARYSIQTLYAIIVNYFVAFLVGLLVSPSTGMSFKEIVQKPWLPSALALGVLFIAVFNLMALTSQKMGVSVASVATKMSFVIAVAAGVILYNDHLSTLNVLGIVLAIAAVYLTSLKDSKASLGPKSAILPFLVFLGSGIIDTSIKWFQETAVPPQEFALFSAFTFFSAGLSGLLFVLIKPTESIFNFTWRNVLGGIALGVPNFFSIYYLMAALENSEWDSATIFTINNVAIVLLSTVLGIILFHEKLSAKNWSGLALALISILLMVIF